MTNKFNTRKARRIRFIVYKLVFIINSRIFWINIIDFILIDDIIVKIELNDEHFQKLRNSSNLSRLIFISRFLEIFIIASSNNK